MTSARAFFDAIAPFYDRDYALPTALTRERMARVLGELTGLRRVLVLGVGTGRELPYLLDAGHDVTGIDVSPAMIAECNKRSRRIPLVMGDFFEALPFPSETFDAAVALHGTLAHPEADGAFARLAAELGRVLAPGGVFVAEVPAADGLAHIAAGGPLALTGPTSFVHQDARSGIAIGGVALSAAEWCAAFAPALEATATPLGPVELLLVAKRRP
jgi:SAM-dependent methyltransferase